MSRHRNLKQYIDEYDDDDYYDEDDYYEEEEQQQAKPKPKPVAEPKPSVATTPAAATTSKAKAPAAAPPPSAPAAAAAAAVPLVVHRRQPAPSSSSASSSVQQLTAKMDSVSLSAFSQALAPPPPSAPSSSASDVRISTQLTSASSSFDFSTPSPDDVVFQARKRQETRTHTIKPAQVPVAALPAAPAPAAAPVPAAPAPLKPKTKAEEKRDEEDDAAEAQQKPFLSLVVVGHVDAGKSTLMGHLLTQLGFVDQKQMHKFEKESRDMGKSSFKYAWVMDEHAEERERGVTIDVGVKRFETANRRILLLDAPGHRDFVPNMIAGAAQADAALLVVPAVVGEFESSFSALGQTREHAWLLKNLGVQHLVVAVNKMDQVQWDEARFSYIQLQLLQFLVMDVGFARADVVFVPVSGLTGDNLHRVSSASVPEWVVAKSKTITQCLDLLPASRRPVDKPLRIVVSDAYKTIHLGLVVSGKVEAGVVRRGDTVAICPHAGLFAVVKEVVLAGGGAGAARRAKAGDNCELALTSKDQLHVLQDVLLESGSSRGGVVLCSAAGQSLVPVRRRFTAKMQTMPALKYPLHVGSQLVFHAHSTSVPCRIVRLLPVADKQRAPLLVKQNQACQVELLLEHAVCVERFQDFRPLSRFLLRFAGNTVAFGVVHEWVDEGGEEE